MDPKAAAASATNQLCRGDIEGRVGNCNLRRGNLKGACIAFGQPAAYLGDFTRGALLDRDGCTVCAFQVNCRGWGCNIEWNAMVLAKEVDAQGVRLRADSVETAAFRAR